MEQGPTFSKMNFIKYYFVGVVSAELILGISFFIIFLLFFHSFYF